MFVIVFNPTQNNIVIDEEGHAVEPGGWAAAQKKFVKELVQQERLLIVDPDSIPDNGNPAATMVKKEVARRNEEAEREAVEAEAQKLADQAEEEKSSKKSKK